MKLPEPPPWVTTVTVVVAIGALALGFAAAVVGAWWAVFWCVCSVLCAVVHVKARTASDRTKRQS